jgi:hypothetical protein
MSNSNSENSRNSINSANIVKPVDSMNMGNSMRYTTPGYTSSDPLNNYQHICDSCKLTKGKKEKIEKQFTSTFGPPGPRPYDANDHITHYLNVCFNSPDVLRCHLEPNNRS